MLIDTRQHWRGFQHIFTLFRLIINNENIRYICNFLLFLQSNIIYHKPFKSTVMLVCFTESHRIDAEKFRVHFPARLNNIVKVDDNSFLVDLSDYTGTYLDVSTWYIDDFCSQFPQRIDFDYFDNFSSITVAYANGSVTFTFFNYE